MSKLKNKKEVKENKGARFIFILIVIVLVIIISYLGKYIYNKYLEFEESNKQVEIYQ